jgi:hypothetical protein
VLSRRCGDCGSSRCHGREWLLYDPVLNHEDREDHKGRHEGIAPSHVPEGDAVLDARPGARIGIVLEWPGLINTKDAETARSRRTIVVRASRAQVVDEGQQPGTASCGRDARTTMEQGSQIIGEGRYQGRPEAASGTGTSNKHEAPTLQRDGLRGPLRALRDLCGSTLVRPRGNSACGTGSSTTNEAPTFE